MNAVEILHRIEAYFDKNHNLFLRFGSLFALVFFTLYIPYTIYFDVMDRVKAQQDANFLLLAEIDTMDNRMQFLELSYEKKQKVMKDVECLAKNIYFEASGESYAGKVAVAQVTMNRVKHKDYPQSVCGVVYQKARGTCQFSWVCQNKGKPRDKKAWQESLRIAESILIDNETYNVVGQAKFFHATYVDPTWSRTKKVVKQVGNHIFYH